MNLGFLQTFLILCEQKNFTITARRLNMTQPGVSKHLKALEEYFATKLVQRPSSDFVLTEKGVQVYEYARDFFRDHESFKSQLLDDDLNKGVCRFSAPGSFGMKMYSFLLNFNVEHPGLSIHFAYAPNKSIISDVLDDKIDIGFVTVHPLDPSLTVEEFDQEKLSLVVPKGFSGNKFADFMELGFINHPDGFHHASRLLESNFPDQYEGMEAFPIRGFINQITRIPEPVALGLGFTALPEYACLSFPGRDLLQFMDFEKKIIDPIYAIRKKGRYLSRRFESILQEFKKQNYLQKVVH